MTSVALVRRSDAPRRRRKGKVALCKVHVYHPTKLSALRTAQALGLEFGVTFDGFALTIHANPKHQ